MANRIDQKFAELRHRGQAGFMAYITAGDPTLEATAELVPALAEAGVDFVELGVPFSDPLADGVVNQLGAQRALTAGAILDLPPDELEANQELAGRHDLKAIRLIAPTTPPARMERIAKTAEGFIYYVSREGVTGEQAKVSDSIEAQLFEIKKHTDLPVAVGFGISTPEQAAQVAHRADAVVVGSAIVRRMGEYGQDPDFVRKIADFVRPMTEATHAAKR
jgi:tryptophan synthase alpha chain